MYLHRWTRHVSTLMDQKRFTRDLFHRSGNIIPICRSCATMGSTYPFWSSALDIRIFPTFHNGMSARVQLDDGDFSTWFNVCQGFRQGCVLPPLVLNIFFCDGHHNSGFAEFRGDLGYRHGNWRISMICQRTRMAQGRGNIGNCSARGGGDVVCRRKC